MERTGMFSQIDPGSNSESESDSPEVDPGTGDYIGGGNG